MKYMCRKCGSKMARLGDSIRELIDAPQGTILYMCPNECEDRFGEAIFHEEELPNEVGKLTS